MTDQAVQILAANATGGTGTKSLIPGCGAQGGKTGTTDKNIDAWFVGFTPKYSTSVWVGFPGSAKISMNGLYFGSNIDGGTYPAQIWGDYMKKVVAKGCGKWLTPKEPFQSQAFQGRYAREGAEDEETGEGEDGATSHARRPTRRRRPRTTSPPTPSRATATTEGDNDDAAFDPGAYESPPQGDPGTAVRKRLPAMADSRPPDWYNLRGQGRI